MGYESSWSLEENCEEIVKTLWQKGSLDGELSMGLTHKLNKTEGALSTWSRQMALERASIVKIELLRKLQENEGSHNIAAIKELQREIGVMLEKEDLRWKQRVKVNWYQLGDKNTKFFHNYANQRMKHNRIHMIVEEQQEDIRV